MALQTSPSSPLILAIENATDCGSVAVVSAQGCMGEYSHCRQETHTRRLLKITVQLLDDLGLTWQQLDCLAISLGPGSFTGLRIGLSTMKGLAMACKLPIVGISTLDGLAAQIACQPQQICAVIDARKQEVYAAFYQYASPAGSQPVRKSQDLNLPPAALLAQITEPTVLVGNGAILYEDYFRENLGNLALFPDKSIIYPRAASIGSLAVGKFTQAQFLNPVTAAPLYVRQSDAELSLGQERTAGNVNGNAAGSYRNFP